MVLVNEAQSYRVCLECHAVLRGEPQEQWLHEHLQPEHLHVAEAGLAR